MHIIKGNLENLTGNAVVFFKVIGENIISPGAEIVAINFAISSLPLEDKLLTANFPPIPYLSTDDLLERLRNINCDVIYGGEMRFPQNEIDLNRFYKNEFLKYNKIIEEYTDKYKEKFFFNPDSMQEKDLLYLLKELTKKFRSSVNTGEVDKNVTTWSKIQKLIDHFRKEFPQKYDIINYAKVILIPGGKIDTLADLYTQKYLTIFYENYEDASSLKKQIERIEHELRDESSITPNHQLP